MTAATTPSAPASTAAGQDEGELAARLRIAVTRMSRRLRQEMTAGLTQSQTSVLASVERLGAPTLGELAAGEQVQPPSMTRLVVALEEAGLVERSAEAGDRRVARVRLSNSGREVLQEIRSARTAYLAERLRDLPGPDRAALSGLVGLLEQLVEEP